MEQRYPIGFLFKQIHNKFVKHFDESVKDDGLTASQLSTLLFLVERQDDKISQKDIGEYLNLKHSTVIGILRRLEAKGFLYCIVDSENKKYRNVIVTKKAIAIQEKMNLRRRQMDAMLVQGFTEEEEIQLRVLLNKILENLAQI